MGKLLDTIDRAVGKPGVTKVLDRHLAAMSRGDKADTLAALTNDTYSSRQIAAGLTKAGYPISPGAVHTYRKAMA